MHWTTQGYLKVAVSQNKHVLNLKFSRHSRLINWTIFLPYVKFLQVKIQAEIPIVDIYLEHIIETGISPASAIWFLYLYEKGVSFKTELLALEATTLLLHKDEWRCPLRNGNSRLKNSTRYTGCLRRNLPYSEGPLVKLYRYNEKCLYPNFTDYRKNDEKSFKEWKFFTKHTLNRREFFSSCTNNPCT